jgi:hypothetical protein
MSQDFNQIVPSIPPQGEEIFMTHHLAFEFRREVEYRENFKAYCQWYQETALKHQQELKKMENDFNILRWFLPKSKSLN